MNCGDEHRSFVRVISLSTEQNMKLQEKELNARDLILLHIQTIPPRPHRA